MSTNHLQLAGCFKDAPLRKSTRTQDGVPFAYHYDQQGLSHNLQQLAPEHDECAMIEYLDVVLRFSQLKLNDLLPGDDTRNKIFDNAIKFNRQRLHALPHHDVPGARVKRSAVTSGIDTGLKPSHDSAEKRERDKENVVLSPPDDNFSVSISCTTTSPPKKTTVFCSCNTLAGRPCKRKILVEIQASAVLSSLKRFCFQHREGLLRASGCYSSPSSKWIQFSDWIPAHLQPDTQAELRVQMAKEAKPIDDKPGYIYAFEVREPTNSKLMIKIGRSADPVIRTNEWDKQCSSHKHILRGIYPLQTESRSGQNSFMGVVKAGKPSPWSQRLERLIVLELADLAAGKTYLGQVPVTSSSSTPGRPKSKSSTASMRLMTCTASLCSDWGNDRMDVFEFIRFDVKNKDWECIILPIINKWISFIETYF